MKEFKLPELGENITTADVLKVLVNKGDSVEIDQPILEIETDKATIEVPSTVSGIVAEILIKDGDKAKVGDVILRLEDKTDQKMGEPVKTEELKTTPHVSSVKEEVVESVGTQKVISFVMPDLGENIVSADILKVLVKSGETVSSDDIILEIETDKATIEIPINISGKVVDVLIKEGDKVNVGETILKIESSSKVEKKEVKPVEPEAKAESKSVQEIQPQQIVEPKQTPVVASQPAMLLKAAPAAPSIRRIAREIGVDINQVPGSGPGGRITMDDVKAFSKKLHEGRIAVTPQTSIQPKAILPDFSKFGEIERQPMSNVRAKTAGHLSYAWATIPHVTQFDKADISELEKMRKQFGKKVEEAGGKLTVTSILLKVIGSALKVFPQFNASVDMEKNELIYKKYVNIGVAVDTDRGLLVPVIRDVDKKNITQLSVELAEISKKARDRKLGLEDMQGGCFSISNLGGIGGTYFTPIVNSPEVAILGISKAAHEPVFINGAFEPRLMMPLSLSYDHRIIDGADGIRFLRWIIQALENPFIITLEG